MNDVSNSDKAQEEAINYNFDVVSSIIMLCNYKYKCGVKGSKYKYHLNNMYLQKLAYFLNVLHMLKYQGKSLFIDSPFELSLYGANLRQVSIDYHRIFGGGWITHCTEGFNNVHTTNAGVVLDYHTFNLKDFTTKHPKTYEFIANNLPLLLVFGPYHLIRFNQMEPQCNPNRYQTGEDIYLDAISSYQFFSDKSNQFWLNPPKVSDTKENTFDSPTHLEQIISNHQSAFEQLMHAFSKYKITEYSSPDRNAKEIPNAITFYAKNSEYNDDAKDTHYNTVIWLQNNTWNLVEVDFRIEPQIKQAIEVFEEQIQKK